MLKFLSCLFSCLNPTPLCLQYPPPPFFFKFCASQPEVENIINCHIQAFFDQTSYCRDKVQMVEWEMNWILQATPVCFRPEATTGLSLVNPVTSKEHLRIFSIPCIKQNTLIQKVIEQIFLLFQQIMTLFGCSVFCHGQFTACQLPGCH